MAKAPLLKVKAIKRGTVAVKSGTYHFDPKSKHSRVRSRSVPVDAAEALVAKGIVKVTGEGSKRTEGFVRDAQRSLIEVAADRREESASGDGEESRMVDIFGAGGADTRDTTLFQIKPVGLIDGQVGGDVTLIGLRRGTEEERAETLLEGADSDADDDEEEDLDDETDSDEDDEEEQRRIDDALRAPGDDQMRQEGNAGGGDAPPAEPAGDDSTATPTPTSSAASSEAEIAAATKAPRTSRRAKAADGE